MKLSACAIAGSLVSLLNSGCVSLTLYTVDPVPKDNVGLTRDETAASLTQGGVTVTVGALRNGSDPNFGILITNNSTRNIEIRSDGASLLANGNPVKLMNYSELQATAAYIKKGRALTSGLMAASGSLAQSSAQQKENVRADEERRQRRTVELSANPVSLAPVTARQQLASSEGARLAARTSSILWSDTHELRDALAGDHGLAEQYYWRTETIPAGRWVLRTIWANTTLGDLLRSQNGQLEVRLIAAGQSYAYRFEAVTRSMGEHLDQRKKRSARAQEAAKE